MSFCQIGLAGGPVRLLPQDFAPSLPLWLVMHKDLRASPRCRLVFDALAAGLAAQLVAQAEPRIAKKIGKNLKTIRINMQISGVCQVVLCGVIKRHCLNPGVEMGKFRGVEGFRFDASVFEKADSVTVASDAITVEYGGNTYIFHGSFAVPTASETGDDAASGDDAEDDGGDEADDDGGETDSDSNDGDGGSDDAGGDDQRVAGTITGIEVKHGDTTLFKAAGLALGFGKFDDEARHHGSAASRKMLMSGDDSVVGSHGRDKLEGHDGNDRLHGDDGNDDLSGGAGRDQLDGGTGNDKLSGGAGNDHLDGGAGADLLAGGTGADVFEFDTVKDSAKGKSHDTISDYKSNDDIDVSGIDANTKAKGDQAFHFIGHDHFSHHAGELRLAGKELLGDLNGDGKADFQVEFSHNVHLTADSFIL